MGKRKTIIVDKKFQLKTTFAVIGVVAVVSVILLSAIAASIVYNNDKINNIYVIEDNIFQVMQTADINVQGADAYKATIDRLTKNHEKNQETIDKIARYNAILLVSLVICVILQGLVLFMMILRITHRISGPIYVMSMYFKEVIEGKIPNPRPLRDKDELKDFYELFKEMLRSIKSRIK